MGTASPIRLSDLDVDPEVQRVMQEAAIAGMRVFQKDDPCLAEGYYAQGEDGTIRRHSWVVIRRLDDGGVVVRYQDQ